MTADSKVKLVESALRWGNVKALKFARLAFTSYRLCIVGACIRNTRCGVYLEDGTLLPLCDDCWRKAQRHASEAAAARRGAS